MLENVAKKYGFSYKENVQSWYSVGRDEDNNEVYESIQEVIYAKNTDGKETPWIFIKENALHVCGNTDNLNLWFYRTRPDMTPKRIINFVADLNNSISSINSVVNINVLIDPEDWQEIADVPDASEDIRYIGVDWKYGDNGNQEYYDATVEGKYLLVFRNHEENYWMCSINNIMIENKTANDVYRKKPNRSLCNQHHCMLSGSPDYLKRKVEYCLFNNITEVCA